MKPLTLKTVNDMNQLQKTIRQWYDENGHLISDDIRFTIIGFYEPNVYEIIENSKFSETNIPFRDRKYNMRKYYEDGDFLYIISNLSIDDLFDFYKLKVLISYPTILLSEFIGSDEDGDFLNNSVNELNQLLIRIEVMDCVEEVCNE